MVAPYAIGQRIRLLPPPAESGTECTAEDWEGEWEVRYVFDDDGSDRCYAIARPGTVWPENGHADVVIACHEHTVAIP